MSQERNRGEILLTRFQFCHVQDKNTGALSLFEGPKRIQLDSHQELVGTFDKIRVFDGQFALVLNPFDKKLSDIQEGEREIRKGPCTFSLHPGEELHRGVQDEFVLTDEDALLLRARKECPNPLNEEERIPAGTEVLLKGPCRFIPHKDIKIKARQESISLAEAQGVFVQDDDTGVVRLVKGPEDFFLEHNESFWDKDLTHEELQALGFQPQNGLEHGSRVLAAAPRPRNQDWEAVVIDLEDKEAICLFDGDKTRVEFGPQTLFLEPHERPKVLFISGGVPVRPNVLRIAKLGLGPDFIRDRLVVRTKDNATLQLEVTFRWRFQVDEEHQERLFALKDFIGFTAQTLSSEIREEAAKHNFEKFHSEAAELVKAAIFGESASRIFTENGLEVFGVDVEGITPEDPEIQRKLADAIKTNVDIFTKRVQEEEQLESERRIITGRAKNEEARKALIDLELANERTRVLEQARITSEAAQEQARGEAESTTIKAKAEREAEEERLKVVTAALEGAGGQAFIKLEQAKFGHGAEKVFVVPTESRVHLGVDKVHDED